MSSSSSTRPRVALIGVSGYGQVYVQLVKESLAQQRLQLVAAVVINPDDEVETMAWLREQGCRIYADYQVMLQEEAGAIDLCLVPTGIHWHACMTIAALEAGANVMVEKPLCASMEEAEAIQAAERKHGRFVAVGFQDFYEPGTQWLKQQLVNREIGDIKSVRFLGLWPRARQYFLRNNWAGRLASNGTPVLDSPLNNAFAHFVMLSLFFADPRECDAASVEIVEAELYRTHAIESFDTGVVRSRTPEGIELWFGASHASRTTIEPVIEIRGSKGVACWRYEEEAWWQCEGGEKQSRRLLPVHGARQHMMDAVLRRMTDPTARVCSPAVAARHTAFISALHAGTPISDFDPHLIDWGDNPADVTAVPAVRELEFAMRTAHAEGSTLTPRDAAWVESS
ncbi:Gfo/Idh/MocA family protein [Actomonas aquatica]|uniref:Gfo/Idh/MocA family oxidoreductase n=1 Tax=Actomonas aquatica TaxID=2866162 RepID=A0ABZ1CI65_9BACT|nr:Gfo/Idh/MocA family oxidoreductase [Opitutus sp. WL0086]WRQ89940.1 Gfo/Idh/MocA family oxidoreductase [Opitutus sp. WL0086]